MKVNGYDISAGTMAIVNVWAISRDPAYWDEPQEFKPERFLTSSMDSKGVDYKYLPFRAGRRGCPRITSGKVTLELALANIVHKFDWSLPDGADYRDLDMSERPGLPIPKATPLHAVATKFHYSGKLRQAAG